jgi:hypothetical protein
MAANALDLKRLPIDLLSIGDAVLVGPYKSPTMPAKIVADFKRDNPDLSSRQFAQRQMLLVDPKTCEAFKVYLLARTE